MLLLDTHAALWLLAGDERLSASARAFCAQRERGRRRSAVTIWEVQIKRTLGRLHAPRAPHHALCRDGVLPLPITDEHALRIGELPPLHRHPFERMLVAQALVEGAAIVSADRRLAAYGVEAPW